MKLFTCLFTAATLASSASAVVIFSTSVTTLTRFTNGAEATQAVNKVNSALSTYLTSKTAEPEFSSYTKAFEEYIKTRSGAPASIILDPERTTVVTSEPAWWTAMPTEIRNYAQEMWDEQEKIQESVIKENAAAKPTGAAKMVGAGMAAVAAGAAVFL